MNLILPINATGYGVAGQNILKSLSEKIKVALWPIGGVQYEPEINKSFHEAMHNATDYNDTDNSVRLYHLNDMALFPVGSGKRFGFPIYELDTFTPLEVKSLKNLDHLLVCSEWAKAVASKYTNIPISVIPLGVNRSVFHEDNEPVTNTTTTFLSCGKWEVRKGHDILLKAFNAAFDKDSNVCLIMNCFNPFIGVGNLEWTSQYKASPLGPKIHVMEERLSSQMEVANMMQSVDCGVFPARSEGWNLELLEMMACGKSVITTNYAAHKEFASKKNALLIEVDETELAYDNVWFHGQGSWAKLGQNQFDCLVEHMRKIHKMKQEGRLTLNFEGIRTSKKFSWEHTADKLLSVINN